jgi:hypothetical protein
MTDKKLEDMTIEELNEYNEKLKKEELLREAKKLLDSKAKADQEAKEAEVAKIQTDAVEAYKAEQLKLMAEQNTGSANADVKVNNTKTPVNLEEQAATTRLNNEFERDRAVLGLPENRKLSNRTYEEMVKALKSGEFRKP